MSQRRLVEEALWMRPPAHRSTTGSPAGGGSPASSAPLSELRSLGADRGVLAVAGIDPGVVRQRAEQPLLDVVDQAGEVLRLPGLAHSSGEEAVAGEDVRARAL